MPVSFFERAKQRWQPIATRLGNVLKPIRRRWAGFQSSWPRTAKVLRWLSWSFVAIFAFVVIAVFGISRTVPSVDEFRNFQTQIASEIYSADSVLLGRYFDQYRIIAKYEDLPPSLVQALVSTEDERFFEHSGIDYRSWGRVLYRTILLGDRSGGGGSTIPQQLAKNLLSRGEYWFFSLGINKVREIVAARRLEKAYTKEELLALYLNTVPFSDNMYGIDVATSRFFSKPVRELAVQEAALLVGTLQATSYYHPVRHPERAKARRNIVLGQMLKSGHLTKAECDSLRALPLNMAYNPVIKNEGFAPYFLDFMRKELDRVLADARKPDGSPYNMLTDGLKVYTTLHTGLQRLAEDAVETHLSAVQTTFDKHWQGYTPPWHDVKTVQFSMRNSSLYTQLKEKGLTEAEIEEAFNQPDTMQVFSWSGTKEVVMTPLDVIKYHLGMLQTGVMVMEPETGFIRAWVGGIDHDFFQYDHVKARRQVGSVFKPLVYAQAIRSGIEPCEQSPNQLRVYHEYAKHDWAIKDYRRDDPEPNFSPDGKDLDDWIPQNADGIYGGSYSMEGALTNSVNVVTVEMIMRAGVEEVMALSQKMGIRSTLPKEPSIALGSAEIPLYEMIQPFAVFANRGYRVPPVAIVRIETSDGKVLADFSDQKSKQVIPTEEADMMTKMLQSVATSGTASRLRWRYGLYDVPIAGKTGTSQNHTDGWFIGYTPKLVAGVWVGGASPLVRFRNFENGQGASSALPIWAFFMKSLWENPDFAAWQGGEFPALPPEQARRLNCSMRIKSAEELRADSLERDSLLLLETLEPLEEGGF